MACLSTHLIESMRLKREGAPHAKLAYEQGYADGLIRSLLDARLATEKEILDFIAELRRKFDGPAARIVTLGAPEETLELAPSAH